MSGSGAVMREGRKRRAARRRECPRIPGSGNSTHVKARSGRKEISLAGIGLVKERMSSDRLGVVDRGLCLCNNVRDFRSLRARESHGWQNNIHGK